MCSSKHTLFSSLLTEADIITPPPTHTHTCSQLFVAAIFSVIVWVTTIATELLSCSLSHPAHFFSVNEFAYVKGNIWSSLPAAGPKIGTEALIVRCCRKRKGQRVLSCTDKISDTICSLINIVFTPFSSSVLFCFPSPSLTHCLLFLPSSPSFDVVVSFSPPLYFNGDAHLCYPVPQKG